MEQKKGRPAKDTAKNSRCELRMSDEDEVKMDYLYHKTGMSKSDILRRGLHMLYNLEKFKD